MVTLPREFVATWYDGYFWNVSDRQLYSIKIDGVLKPLKKIYPGYQKWNKWVPEPGYRVSVQGKRKFMAISKLIALKTENSEIPVR